MPRRVLYVQKDYIICIHCVCTVLLLVALASRHAAQESNAASGQGELQRGSPQYIYMQHLHSSLMEKKERVTASLESTDGGGTLLATSFESHKLLSGMRWVICKFTFRPHWRCAYARQHNNHMYVAVIVLSALGRRKSSTTFCRLSCL